MEDEIIYFEVNNWFAGRDYPAEEPFLSWLGNDLRLKFHNEDWCKENKICVVAHMVDMSQNFCVTAPRSWVEENCPCILNEENERFLREPDSDGDVYGRFNTEFLKYEESNFGCEFRDDPLYSD